MPSQPLSGITVLDLSRLIPGPFCSLILADLGARVIKIEDPQGGDYLRWLPSLADEKGSILFDALNRSKENICLNLKDKKGIALFLKLVRKADVVIESFRPDVLSRLGLPFARLKKANPKIILASISGYGRSGPRLLKAGHDLNYLSLSGVQSTDRPADLQWADLVGGGLYAALGILSALSVPKNKRKASHLDISMTDSMIFTNLINVMLAQFGAKLPALGGNLGRYRMYTTADNRKIALAALESKFWNRFCDLIGRNDLKDDTNQQYIDFNPTVHNELERYFAQKDRDGWLKEFENEDICLTPVLEPKEVVENHRSHKKNLFLNMKTDGKNIFFPVLPFAQSFSQNRFRSPRARGQDSLKILRELGISKKHIQEFLTEGVVKGREK